MIITLTGTNDFLVKSEARQLVQAFLTEHDDLAFEKFDGEELGFEQLRDAVQSLPFLAAKKMVLVRDASRNKDLADKFAAIIDATGETTDLVLVETKLDKRSAYYKLLKAKTDYRERNALDERALAGWVASTVKERGGTISQADANLLVERIGGNQLMLNQEVDKLLAYKPAVTAETIRLLTEPTPQSTVFDLLEAAFAGKTKHALALYADQRQQKVEPQMILAMLAWQLHILAVVKTAGQKPGDDIAKAAKLNPYVVRKTQNLARSVSLPQLKALVARTTLIDKRLKSEALDADEAMHYLLMTLHQPA